MDDQQEEIRQDVEQWLSAARDGSSEALGNALEACRAYLLLIAEREIDPGLRAKGGASDIVQETLLKAHRAFPAFTSHTQQELLAWLRTMLLNNLADFRRTYLGTQKRSAAREVTIDGNSSSADWQVAIPADSPTPSGEFSQRETVEAMKLALARLPEDYQRVIAYRYDENCSFDEIASRMQRTPNAVQKLFARAIDRLQTEMERDE